MKNCLLFTILLFVISDLFSQAPQGISYQTIVRDNSGEVISNQNVSFRFSVLQGSASGNAVYTETHNLSTNSLGLVNLFIGDGNAIIGTFSAIDWANGPFFLEVDLDPSGGSNYITMGTQQMMSVPYALYAETANVPGLPGPAGPVGPVGPAGSDGTDGADGIGIVQTTDNQDGTFTFTYSDGTTFTTSDLSGPIGMTGPAGAPGIDGVDGSDGVGIVQTTDNQDGTFTFTYSDGTTFTTSDLTGPPGSFGNTVLPGTGSAQSMMRVIGGDLVIDNIGFGVVMKSPDGNCWKLEVENSGNLTTQSVVCP